MSNVVQVNEWSNPSADQLVGELERIIKRLEVLSPEAFGLGGVREGGMVMAYPALLRDQAKRINRVAVFISRGAQVREF